MAMGASDLETGQMYVPLRVFTVIEGNQTAERFNDMHRLLNKNRAAQFWGVEEEWAKIHGKFFNSVVQRPDTIENRFIAIKYALRSVPEPDKFTEAIAYTLTARDLVTGARKVQSKKIPDSYSRKKGLKLGLTYAEAHDTPEIRSIAVIALHEIGDPVTEVVRSLEGWRRANSGDITLTDHQLREGYEAFDALLLTSESSPYAVELGRVASKLAHS